MDGWLWMAEYIGTLCLMSHNFSSNKIKMTDSNEGTLCPKVLCELVQSKEPSVHPELGVTLSDVASGGVQHRTHKGNMKRAFFNFLNRHEKYAPFMDPVLHSGVHVPRMIVSCMPDSGGDSKSKVKLVNEMLVDFAAGMKLSKPPKDGRCPFLQPSTQCQYLRTLLTGMKDDYGWDFKLDSSFKFKGGVKTVVDQLFEKRRTEYDTVSTSVI